jgi:hypothetical protein
LIISRQALEAYLDRDFKSYLWMKRLRKPALLAELAQFRTKPTFKTDTETQLTRERMAAEMELSRWKTAQEVKLRRASIAAAPRVQMNSGAKKEMNGGSGVRFGGHVG